MLGERALDFAESVYDVGSVDELCDIFSDAVEHFGMETFACGRLPSADDPAPKFYAIHWPTSFAEPYQELELYKRDPVLRAVLRGEEASTWAELQRRFPQDFHAWYLLNAIRDAGWREGYFVPVSDNDRPGCIGLAGQCTKFPGGRRERTALKMIANIMYEKAREIAMHDGSLGDQSVSLTPRQREVLHWVAAGLGDAAVADRLQISEATAHFHVERAKRRLGARTRSQAVAVAVHRGLIRP